MIDDALTNPPMPEWNNLSNDEKEIIIREGEMYSCSCCGDDAGFYVYLKVREILRIRERRFLDATMAGPTV